MIIAAFEPPASGTSEPIATLRMAMIYQRFLDGIEQSERRYHEADVPQQLRDTARRAIEERP